MPAELLSTRLTLPSVTLAAITSVAHEATAAAICRCLEQVDFAEVLWISDAPPPRSISDRCRWVAIPRITSRVAYSQVMLSQLGQWITTSHLLCVQWDGFVLDAAQWSDVFLEYDYIGAPWYHFDDGMSVGNGGFSLRSSKLLAASATISADNGQLEDVLICRFSFERGIKGHTFGFHGAFNLVRMLPAKEAGRFFAALEPILLSDGEHREILRWALRAGRWQVAAVMAKRLLHRRARARRNA
jgi:Protein of unknown function (DUF5672)